ncbi:unnamed protein product [Lepidochelys kempii]
MMSSVLQLHNCRSPQPPVQGELMSQKVVQRLTEEVIYLEKNNRAQQLWKGWTRQGIYLEFLMLLSPYFKAGVRGRVLSLPESGGAQGDHRSQGSIRNPWESGQPDAPFHL